jgi:chromodomain-helicase-DNA-binding protein 1
MASTTPSPVSHIPGPLNINYDSDDDMQVDSESDRLHPNIKEPDPDADGESDDDNASPPPSTINIAGPSLSHRLDNSVRLYIISYACIFNVGYRYRTQKTRCAAYAR